MGKIVLAVVAGFLAAGLVTGLMGWAADYVFPPSPLVDMNPELIKTVGAPLLGTLTKLLAWLIGTFLGGMIAMRLAEMDVWPAVAVGGLMALSQLVLMFLAPHQLVYVVLSLGFIAAAAFGAAWLSTHGQPSEA